MIVKHMIESSFKNDKNDIFFLTSDSPQWQRLERSIEVIIETSKDFDEEYASFEQDALVMIAAASEGFNTEEISFGSLISTGFNALYYKLFSSKRKIQLEVAMNSPDPRTLINIFNFLETKYAKVFLNFVLSDIKVNKRIYVPKLLPCLTLKDLAANRNVKITNPEIKPYIDHKMKAVPNDFVKIRILSPEILPNERKSGYTSNVENMKFDKILIDIHGGGFIATTTRSHQTYLRKWANECNLVIFAIDYKLAPDSKYPIILDDVWQAYYWIITQADKEFGLKINTVLVAGDSAGGNLAMALTLLSIRTHFRVPDGLLLGYPALNLSVSSFSPSLLISLDDIMLHYSILLICMRSYLPNEADPLNDPYVSPILIPDQDLLRFPPIRIMAAGRDPLRDESYRLMVRLTELSKDAKMIEYRKFPHGYWNLDMSFGLEEFKSSTKKAIELINDLLKYNTR